MDENIQADVAYANALNSGLMGLSEMTNPLLDKLQNIAKPIGPDTNYNMSTAKQAELKALAEKQKRKQDQKAYWLGTEKYKGMWPGVVNATIDALTGLNFNTPNLQRHESKINPTKSVIEDITLDDFRNGSTFSNLAKQGMKIEYINLFK